MPQRYEYLYRFETTTPDRSSTDTLPGLVRHPALTDADELADLMLDAYLNTIDYDGETLDDARAEINSFLSQHSNPPLLACSWFCADQHRGIAACLVSYWTERAAPLIAYVMTRAAHKQHSFGRRLVQQSLVSVQQAGYSEAWAVITAGNIPSERLFDRLGFVRQPHT
jgi:L-amino acid N-acyltransferase YncA